MKPKRVLMLIENDSAPSDSRVWDEATALRDCGFEVSIICPKGTKDYRESSICIDGIRIYRYRLPAFKHAPGPIAYILEYIAALVMTTWLSMRQFVRGGFDVIHAANPPDIFFLVAMVYRLLGKKFIFDQHDLAPELFQARFSHRMQPLQKVLLLFERLSYRTADVVITSNNSQKQMALQRGGCPDDKVFVVRNGPCVRHVSRPTPEPELKRGWKYLLAYVGVMGVQDAVDYTLYALHDLVYTRGRRDTSLVLLGDGECAPTLRSLAHELRLDDYVHFTGWVQPDDIARYLAVADIGICPDPQNGLSELSTTIKTMEYMAFGLPIVAFDLAETRFTAQGAALYATPNRVHDFAAQINTLLEDAELRHTLGAIGRKRLEDDLNWEHARRNLVLAYELLFHLRIRTLQASVPVNWTAASVKVARGEEAAER
jgi:glycosyltransferase involved in cell wall biosynthesis